MTAGLCIYIYSREEKQSWFLKKHAVGYVCSLSCCPTTGAGDAGVDGRLSECLVVMILVSQVFPETCKKKIPKINPTNQSLGLHILKTFNGETPLEMDS